MTGSSQTNPRPMVLIMGGTGTGKSTFIKHVTGQTKIQIGHKPDSETFDVGIYSYDDPHSRLPVMIVDTPGFDDSREGVTDTDILEKIATFLHRAGQRIAGVIYMYRISDVRIGGMARKNLRMFKELCGDNRLGNVRIVSTNWDRVGIEEGNQREADLAQGPFQPLLDAGAKMARQDDGRVSAQLIMSELIRQRPVTLKITEEMNYGIALGETSAGRIIVEEVAKLQKRYEEELMELLKEMEEADVSKQDELSGELVAEQKALEDKMRHAARDKHKLQEMRIRKLERELRHAASRERPRRAGQDEQGHNGRSHGYKRALKHVRNHLESVFRAPPAQGRESYVCVPLAVDFPAPPDMLHRYVQNR